MEVEVELCNKWKSWMIQRKSNWQSPGCGGRGERIKGSYQPPLTVAVKLDTQDVCMELDTGAPLSTMSEIKPTQRNIW